MINDRCPSVACSEEDPNRRGYVRSHDFFLRF